MNDPIKSGTDVSKQSAGGIVQTSAQTKPDVVHKEPAVGGSYIRVVETGDLVKQDPAAESIEKE